MEFWGDDGRGDPLLQGRRPALAWRSPSTACGRRPAASCCSPTRCASGPRELAEQHPELAELLDKLAEGIAVEGMESLAPVLVDDMELLLDVLPAGRHGRGLRPRAGPHPGRTTWSPPAQEFLEASWAAAAGGGEAPIDLGAAALRQPRRRPRARPRELGMPWWSVTPVRRRRGAATTRTTPSSSACTRRRGATAATPRGRSPTSRAGSADGWRVVLRHRGPRPGRSALVEVLARRGHRRAARRRRSTRSPEPGVVHVTLRLPRPRLRRRRRCSWPCSPRPTCRARRPPTKDMRRMPSPAPQRRRPAAAAGRRLRRARAARRRPLRRDGAAHRAGRHPRVPRRRVRPGQARPARRPALRAHRPARPGHQLRRRRGARRCTGSAAPTGTKTKGRARKAVKEIAGELIRLYSARMAAPGHAFGPDTPWQRELEDAFPYVETPDQLDAIDEVKARHGEAGPDGPADLRRRRLRQDRDRGARRVQGGAGRQAGRRAGADDAARAAALRRRSPSGTRSSRSTVARAVALPDRQGGRRRSWRACATARSTSSSAPTGCSRPRCSSRTSAWSSSTRSSASASSTRSS